MNKIELVNLPLIPDDLLESTESIIAKPFAVPLRKNVSDKLFNYLQALFKEPISVYYATIKHGLAPHKDVSGRKYGYNFILNTGGDCAVTTIYDTNLTITQEVICKPKSWYKIPTAEWHSIHGIHPDHTRIIVTVTYLHDQPAVLGEQPNIHPALDKEQWLYENNRALFKKCTTE